MNNIHSEQIDELTIINGHIEINTIKINTASLYYIICSIYRPNNKHIAVEEFSNLLHTLFQKNIKKSKVIVIGDLNISLLEHDSHTPTNNFIACLQTINFFPHIARPTRFPDNINLGEPFLLDHVYTNFTNNFTSGILHFPISDH